MTEPIPDLQWGKGDWQDYTHNWREKDAEFLQARTITRYHNATDRDAAWPTPSFGQVVYNETSQQPSPGVYLDRPEMFSKQHNTWVPLLMLANITSTKDDSQGVALSHKLAGGKGVIFEPTRTLFDNPINVMTGVMLVDNSGVSIRTGAKTAKLTTDATNLISDSPFSAPSVVLTGTGVVFNAAGKSATLGTLTADTVTATTLNVTTVSANVLNGSSGVIGGVQVGTGAAHGSGGVRADAQGLHAQWGAFYGDGANAFVRPRNPATGVYGGGYIQVNNDANIYMQGPGSTYMNNYLRIMGGRGVPWHNAGGTHVAWIAPVIYSGGDPGAANYPDGTLWIS
jgi:hypothetical protein